MSPCDPRVAGLGIGADPSGRPLVRRQAAGSESARPAVAIANPKVAILAPQKCPDKLQSKNSCGQKGEKTSQSTLLKGTLPKSIQASGLFTKPNCIVYIIRLERADKENFG
jgi:hypothetical protein